MKKKTSRKLLEERHISVGTILERAQNWKVLFLVMDIAEEHLTLQIIRTKFEREYPFGKLFTYSSRFLVQDLDDGRIKLYDGES